MRSSFIRFSPFLAVATVAFPALASAATILNLLALANTVFNALIGLLITLAIVTVFWGIIKYLFNSGSEGKAEGLKIALYGVGAIFIMVSIWGIIRLLQSTFGVTSTDPVIPKGIQINTGGLY